MIDELNGDFLQRLRGFFYVAKTGSFSAASREMRRNQSTISYQVRQLEESLNADLFLRTGRGAALTPQGRQLFNMVLDIFDKIEDIQRCMLGKNREASGPVHFAVSPLALHGVLIPLLPKLHAAFPAVRFTIQQVRGWDDSVHRDIISRVLDFAVVPADGVLTGLRFTPFYRSQTVLCAPRDMPLAQEHPLEHRRTGPAAAHRPQSHQRHTRTGRRAHEKTGTNPQCGAGRGKHVFAGGHGG